MLNRVYGDCEKLMRISSKVSFREADFLDAVRTVAGDDAVHQCRDMLDGIECSGRAGQLQSMVVEGRCVVCRGSTYEEDMERETADAGMDEEQAAAHMEIVLCDGCNAEVHLKCLKLTAVPSSEWHCAACTERLQQRDAKVDHSFDSLEGARSHEAEEELIERAVDSRLAAEAVGGALEGNERSSSDCSSEVKIMCHACPSFD